MASSLIDEIAQAIEAKYHAKGWDRDWLREKAVIREIADEIFGKPLESRFKYIEVRGVGSTGVVLVVDDLIMEAKRAMKLPRPRGRRRGEIAEAFGGEIQRLLALNHQNIVKIYHRGTVRVRETNYPYFVMEFIGTGGDLHRALKDGIVDAPGRLLEIVKEIATGLDFLHSRDIVHFDVKPDNILVPSDGQAMITDLGFSKDLSVVRLGQEVGVRFTEKYAHPKLLDLLREQRNKEARRDHMGSQAARVVLTVNDAQDVAEYKAYDRFALGQTLFEVLGLHACKAVSKLSEYDRKYLELIAARLTNGKGAEATLWGKLDESTFRQLSYQNTSELRADTERLSGDYSLERDLPELNPYIPDLIQIPAICKVPFTKRVKQIIEHRAFRRLAQISQLGLLAHVYPSASHSRLEHALGTFSTACEYVRALYYDEESPLFRSVMRKSDIETVLLASLLHDIGQYPLAHDLADVRRFFGHDRFNLDILDGEVSPGGAGPSIWAAIDETVKEDEVPWEVDRETLRQLVGPGDRELPLPFRAKILRALINGPIDADKLDYIYRDSIHLGIAFGAAVDLPRLMKCLTIVLRSDGTPVLGVLEKGHVVADAVGFARYGLFSAAYWHHTSRAIKAMIQHIAMLALRKGDDAELRAAFKTFVFESVEPAQLGLAIDPQDRGTFIFDSQVRREDVRVLEWLAGKAGTAAARLLVEDLAQRRLYKRLLEFNSDDKSEDMKRVWQNISSIRRGALGLEVLEECWNELENALLTSSALPADIRKLVAEKAEGRPLVLIDFPWRRCEDEPCDVVVCRGSSKDEQTAEPSDLLRLLYDDEFFNSRVSCLRVFVNPRIRGDLMPYKEGIAKVLGQVVKAKRGD